MNVMHAPVNVGSQASGLASGENQARANTGRPGRSWSADFRPSLLTSAADHAPTQGKMWGNLIPGKLLAPLAAMFYGLRKVAEFDALHLYFGNTMLVVGRHLPGLGQMDMLLWKKLGKRIFVTFQGCDARIRSISCKQPISACKSDACAESSCDRKADEKRVLTIKYLTKYSDKRFCLNPDLLQFVPDAEFLPYANLAPSLLNWEPESSSSKPVVVHAPSDRTIKGTCFLEQASEQLQSSHPHKLQLVENCSRKDALNLYRKASIVVDQLLVGMYGGLAVETMAIGLPVVSYLNQEHLTRIPEQMRCDLPVVSATPHTITEVLARLLEDSLMRRELGQSGKRYVKRWHDPVRIASRMLDLYKDPSLAFWDSY